MFSLEVVLGSYEGYVLAYEVQANSVVDDDGAHLPFLFVPSFTNNFHTGAVRSLQTNGDLLVTGSSDEKIQVVNLRKRIEVGSLCDLGSSVTSLAFSGAKLFIGCGDGTLVVCNRHGWECVHSLHKHKSAINDIAIHPSGKVLLTVGADRTLRTWDVSTGKCAFVINLQPSPVTIIKWSLSGDKFLTVINQNMEIYASSTCKVEQSLKFDSKVHCIVTTSDDVILYGLENGKVEMRAICNPSKKLLSWIAHEKRVKCLSVVSKDRVNNILTSDSNSVLVISGSSDGFVKLWKLVEGSNHDAALLAQVNTRLRLLCIAFYWRSRAHEASGNVKPHAVTSKSLELTAKRKTRKRKLNRGELESTKT